MVKLYGDSSLLNKHFIGFDEFFNSMERITQKEEKNQYPPYSIYKNGENTFVISLAVAGFKKKELQIELKAKILSIVGRKEKQPEATEYYYRGISNRNFARNFTLADDVEIKSATLEDGILDIVLIRDMKKNVKTIEIVDNKEFLSSGPDQLNG